jgi:hypothetical protein
LTLFSELKQWLEETSRRRGRMREISPTQNWILIAAVLATSGVIYDSMF